jgi:hypothetical protein
VHRAVDDYPHPAPSGVRLLRMSFTSELTHPDRLKVTHPVLEDGRSVRERQNETVLRALPLLLFHRPSKAIALAVHLKNVAAVCEAVQKGRGHSLTLENLVPFSEG